MAKLIALSHSSLFLSQQAHTSLNGNLISLRNYEGATLSSCFKPAAAVTAKLRQRLALSTSSTQSCSHVKGIHTPLVLRASSVDTSVPGEEVDLKLDSSSGGGDEGGNGDQNSGGGDGNGGDGNGNKKGDEGFDDADDSKLNKGLLMSQKITLAYAALVGLGGLMGYLKSGSLKSLGSGGFAALLLYYVFTELPKRAVFASSVGLGISAALLVVMGSRFKSSGKFFPAGVVSLVSLIMTGGYIHGITKTH